ncbi:hypothetical protein BKA59DRAFT_456078 [Fusarium tricinctum]|uniref:Uncharacterized protein n=1 Tax=Fusarium tricinctum TaxID=61284 RepID=A0A8K0RSU2_9HYPO|nr:hypothetical protein BKA59DRAFT_456078 [Fusarium tricinctum]
MLHAPEVLTAAGYPSARVVEEPRDYDVSKLLERPDIDENAFAGVASIHVLYRTSTGADWGSLCMVTAFSCYHEFVLAIHKSGATTLSGNNPVAVLRRNNGTSQR